MSTQGVKQPTPPIPDELKIAVENAQNRYTVLESEIARLTKLNKQERHNVDIALEEQARLKKESEGLKDSIALLLSEKREMEAARDFSVIEANKAKTELDALTTKLGALQAKADATSAELSAQQSQIVELNVIKSSLKAEAEAIKAKTGPYIQTITDLFNQL